MGTEWRVYVESTRPDPLRHRSSAGEGDQLNSRKGREARRLSRVIASAPAASKALLMASNLLLGGGGAQLQAIREGLRLES